MSNAGDRGDSKLIRWLKLVGTGTVPALIGSVEGESLAEHIKLAVNEGRSGVA